MDSYLFKTTFNFKTFAHLKIHMNNYNIFISILILNMDFKELDIISISFDEDNNNLFVTYSNNEIETVPKNDDTYFRMYDEWLLDQPMFISDIFKTQMRELFFVAKNNDEQSLNSLNTFFCESNKDQVLKFLTFMRKRDLTEEKKKWTVKN
jgi:hypothetical protein